MPTYQVRNGRVRAIVRVKGFEAISDTFPNKTKAKAWALKTEADMRDGTYVAPTKQTFKAVIERYLKEEELDRWTSNRLKALVRDEKWVELPLSEVHDPVAHWVEQRRKEVKPNTVRREATILSGVFRHAIKRWRIKLKINPMRDVELPSKDPARNRRVKQSEIDALWAECGHTIPERAYGTTRAYIPWMFEFACETGMRLGEIAALEWKDVNLQERWAFIPKSKNGDARHALLTARAATLLSLLPKKIDRVFPVNKASLGTQFRGTTVALGFEDLHFHDSRHEACTRLARFLTVMELARVIGHRDLKSLMVYYNPTAAELAAKLPGGATRPTPPRP